MIVVNVNPLYTPRELRQQLADSGATVIVIMENFAHKLEAVLADTKIRHVVVARLGDFVPLLKRWAFNFANSYIAHAVPAWHFDTFTMLQDACDRPPSERYRGCPAASGRHRSAAIYRRNDRRAERRDADASQSGREYAAVLRLDRRRHHARRRAGANPAATLPYLLADRELAVASRMFGGLDILIPDPRDLHRLIRIMRNAKITWMSGVNTLFNALVNMPDFATLDFSALRVAVGGGAAVQSEVARRWREITGSELVEGYGLTEASPVVCINPFLTPKIGTVGLPVPSTEVTIRDDAGNVLAIGEHGEVWVRGPQVMHGYWGRPDETKAVHHAPTAGCAPAISAPSTRMAS